MSTEINEKPRDEEATTSEMEGVTETQDPTVSTDSASAPPVIGEETAPDEEQKDLQKKALLEDLYKERSTRKSLQSEVDKLKGELDQLSSVQKELDTLKTYHKRLEQFLLQSGSELSRLLDSRTFTEKLYESDEDIQDIVKEWHKANPTPTNLALTKDYGADGDNKIDMNRLLRAAAR